MPGGGLSYPEHHRFSGDESLMTITSEDQRVTELSIHDILKRYLPQPGQVPELDRSQIVLTREKHRDYIDWYIANSLPWQWTALDASRPWQMYWSIHPFVGILGNPLLPEDKRRLVETLKTCRPLPLHGKTTIPMPKGGFGGGPGQIMHLAPCYAGIMSLATVLSTREEWDAIVDRQDMYDWLITLKQPDGSFVMHHGGEVDVRASYCALSIAALLNILTPELTENAAQFLVNCQTYEGGFACAAYPYALDDPSANPPLAEAHGGYAFCALAAFFILCPADDTSPEAKRLRGQIDWDALLRWAAHMQALPMEGAGFRGRTNKLVDGCYSWWNGGLFQFIQAYLSTAQKAAFDAQQTAGQMALFDREGLQEYILLISQAKEGGLQDKPGKANDSYHTCYTLSGLSAAQNNPSFSPRPVQSRAKPFVGRLESKDEAQSRASKTYTSLLAWDASDAEGKVVVGIPENLVLPVHPVFNVGLVQAKRTLDLFYS